MHTSRPRAAAAAIVSALTLLLAAGCSTSRPPETEDPHLAPGQLVEVARSNGYQWTGVAASKSGRIFVNYPRWHDPMRWSVAEIRSDGTAVPFPNAGWQSWTPAVATGLDKRWVCVQSVHVDSLDRLWVLDPGSPQLAGVVPGAAKLVQFNLKTNKPVRTYSFDDAAAPRTSYLNDVRIDPRTNTAYITDSGLGAIVVLDLETGKARRLLADHASTKAEPGFIPRVGGGWDRPGLGQELRFADGPNAGQVPQIHSDGIALSPDGQWLYYQPITGRTLYRVPTSALRDESLAPAAVASRVESLGPSVVTDGMEFDDRGNLYFTSLEFDAIAVRHPDGAMGTVVTDNRLAWPDTIARGPHGTMLVSTAQIHRTPWFKGVTTMPATPYYIFAFKRAE